MKFTELARDVIVKYQGGALAEVEVRRIHCDSRKIQPGDLFCALVDAYRDGREFVPAAIEAGAVGLVLPARPEVDPGVPWIAVPNVAEALARMAAAVMDHPSRKMTLVGVTGTNGKTTTCHILEAIVQSALKRPALLGTTVGARYANKTVTTGLTTPEAPELQELLADMVQAEVDVCAMEVSSHGIALKRVEACEFAAGVLTGVGSDHLDFHADHADYAQTKVEWLLGEVQASPTCLGVVVPIDDEFGREVHQEFRKNVITFGWDEDADIFPSALEMTPTGSRGRISTPEGTLSFDLKLAGRHNVRNAMAAIGAAQILGLEPIAIVEGIMRVRGVPGRFEAVENQRGFTVLVDYAHTPDALDAAISSVRELTEGRIIVVFGCGGDRDRAKRPEMARVVADKADHIVVTSDNPRTEDPHEIIEEILLGIPVGAAAGRIHVEPDRRAAIELAIGLAEPGDVVLIAGKGHETGQIIGEEKLPFDDRIVAAEVLAP